MFSTFRNAALAAILAGLGLLAAGSARAVPITYDFTVNGGSTGPLAGVVAHGSFSYDSSSIVPGGNNEAINLLTSLSFSWNGVAYTAATANTGSLGFDTSGNLIGAVFGTNCSPTCNANPADNKNEFYVQAVPGASGGPTFTYTLAGNTTDQFHGFVTATTLAVPEPASLPLLVVGLAGLGLVLRTWRA